MKKFKLLLLSCFFAFSLVIAQPLSEQNPRTVGIASDKLTQLDNFIESYIQQGAVPGGVFLIARKGKIAYFKAFGNRSLADNKPYQKDDIFRIASMTKAMTTVSILQLYEQGKLGLDDPIHYYLPAFKEMKLVSQFNPADSSFTTRTADNAITIRHLLTHTSGIIYGDFVQGKMNIVYQKYNMTGVGLSHEQWTTNELLDQLAKVPLAFEPGEKYTYGLNMEVLGGIIQVISGMSLSDYFQKNIFDPLGMKDTYFYLPQDKHDRLVPIYTIDQDRALTMLADEASIAALNYPLAINRDHFAGGGGLSSTALDYAIFIQALVNGGQYNGQRILGRNTIETMTADQMITLNQSQKGYSKLPGLTYGLGFALYTDPAAGLGPKSPGTYEWGGYFNTKFFIDPSEELTFVGMTQVLPFYRNDFWTRMYAIIYGTIED